jgi:hypothetical protein
VALLGLDQANLSTENYLEPVHDLEPSVKACLCIPDVIKSYLMSRKDYFLKPHGTIAYSIHSPIPKNA